MQPQFDYLYQVYATSLAACPHLRISQDELAAKAADAVALAGQGGSVENYTYEVFSSAELRQELVNLEAALTAHPDDTAKALVNDAIVAACLVPVRDSTTRNLATLGTSELHHRQAIEVMPISVLVSTLAGIRAQLTAGGDALDGASMRGMTYDPAAPAAQRLGSLALLNLAPDAREQLTGTEQYQRLSASGAMTDVLFASNGHDEQQYMNTCFIASMNTDLKSRTPGVLGLVQVGRGTVEEIEAAVRAADRANARPNELDERDGSWGSGTVRELVIRRTYEAEDLFREMEAKVDEWSAAAAITDESRDEMAALVDRWGAVTQKLSATRSWIGGSESVVTKKIIPGAWLGSAIATLPKALSDRVGNRTTPASDDNYMNAMGAQITDRAAFSGDETAISALVDQGAGSASWLSCFWEEVQSRNGIPITNPGHNFYLRAIRDGGDRTFAVSDPKATGLDYYSVEDFGPWARSNRIYVSTEVSDAVTTRVNAATADRTQRAAERQPGQQTWVGTGQLWPHGDPYPMIRNDNKAVLDALEVNSWAPYWTVLGERVTGGNQRQMMIGYEHHSWLFENAVDREVPEGYLVKKPGRFGRSTWQASGPDDRIQALTDELRALGWKGDVTPYSDADPDTGLAEVTFENQRALKQDLAEGGALAYWVSTDWHVLIGASHDPAWYQGAVQAGAIRKGSSHYYVSGDASYLESVRQAIEETGSDRKVVQETA